MKKLVVALLLALLAAPLLAQGVPIKSGADSNLLTVNSNKAALVNHGASSRTTYIASGSALATTALYGLAVESSVSLGFKVAKVCVGVTSATAAAGFTVKVFRTTAASSGGTVLTAEGTGATAISKMDPGAGNYGGVARAGAITTTAGATLDQWSAMVGEIGAGTADPPGLLTFCRYYGDNGEQMPIIVSGTANGAAVTVTSLGAGGLAFGSIAMTIIAE